MHPGTRGLQPDGDAIDVLSGRVVWRAPEIRVDVSTAGAAISASGCVYVACSNELVCLEAASGRRLDIVKGLQVDAMATVSKSIYALVGDSLVRLDER